MDRCVFSGVISPLSEQQRKLTLDISADSLLSTYRRTHPRTCRPRCHRRHSPMRDDWWVGLSVRPSVGQSVARLPARLASPLRIAAVRATIDLNSMETKMAASVNISSKQNRPHRCCCRCSCLCYRFRTKRLPKKLLLMSSVQVDRHQTISLKFLQNFR